MATKHSAWRRRESRVLPHKAETAMSRLRTAETASVWPGSYEISHRDIRGEMVEAWAAEERGQRAGVGRGGITEPELRRLLGASVERAAVPTCRIAA